MTWPAGAPPVASQNGMGQVGPRWVPGSAMSYLRWPCRALTCLRGGSSQRRARPRLMALPNGTGVVVSGHQLRIGPDLQPGAANRLGCPKNQPHESDRPAVVQRHTRPRYEQLLAHSSHPRIPLGHSLRPVKQSASPSPRTTVPCNHWRKEVALLVAHARPSSPLPTVRGQTP